MAALNIITITHYNFDNNMWTIEKNLVHKIIDILATTSKSDIT